jgi:RNA polymerase sigma factor for flagellar operon FliA
MRIDFYSHGIGTSNETITQEFEWWHKFILEQCEATRHKLISYHLNFAKALAAKLYAFRVQDEFEFEEYLQFARAALIEAVGRFDPSRGIQFRTFAYPRITGAVLSGLEKLSDRSEQIKLRERLKRDRLTLTNHSDISQEGDNLLHYLADIGMGLALGHLLEESNMILNESKWHPDHAYAQVELKQFTEKLRNCRNNLTERERQVIELHYFESNSFDQIADVLGLSKTRVAQIHLQAIQRLKKLVIGK